jgi:hypothetical protein
MLVACLAVGACSSDKNSPPRASNPALVLESDTTTQIKTSPSPPSTSACPRTGLWAECSLERRLKQSGFVVSRLSEQPSRAGFTTTPVVYSLGKTRVEAFFYKTEAALTKDLQSLDTLAVVPKGSTGGWPSPPTLLHSANLAAVVLGQDARQSERVMLAITAGPPQPNSPR